MEKPIDKSKVVCAVSMHFDIANNDAEIAISRTESCLTMHCHMGLASSKMKITELVVIAYSVIGKK